MTTNEIIRDELNYRGLVIKEFAKKCEIPYRTFISYLSKEQIKPSIESLYKIAKNLNVSMEYLITGDEKDNYILNYDIYTKELISLPTPVFKKIISLIHSLYEMNNE